MTTNAERAAARRSFAGPALFSYGFRPFFLLAGVWAPAVLLISLWMMFGDPDLPVARAPVDWHVHELLFGYLVAAIAEFLLTAIPSWTGRLPVKGWPLAGLAGLWIVGRVADFSTEAIGLGAAAAADLAFLAVLAFVAAREILKGGNWHNVPIVAAIVLLFAANAVFHAELAGWPVGSGTASRLGVAIITLLVALIGGRIVPSFTRNWLARHDKHAVPAPFGGFDKLTLGLTFVALAAWTVVPDGIVVGGLLAVAAPLNAVRLARWQGLRTGAEPLLGVLHLGYLWIPVGLALLAISAFAPAQPQAVGLHALTVGSMATMTLAVMSRATLGHTGRALTVTNGLVTAYLLITLAALSRVLAPLFAEGYMPLVTLSAATWVGAFMCFLIACGPMLIGPRTDGRGV